MITDEELLARARVRRAELRRQHEAQADSAARALRAAGSDLQLLLSGTAQERREILPRMVARVESERDEQRQAAAETDA